jgi:hypothetical protein
MMPSANANGASMDAVGDRYGRLRGDASCDMASRSSSENTGADTYRGIRLGRGPLAPRSPLRGSVSTPHSGIRMSTTQIRGSGKRARDPKDNSGTFADQGSGLRHLPQRRFHERRLVAPQILRSRISTAPVRLFNSVRDSREELVGVEGFLKHTKITRTARRQSLPCDEDHWQFELRRTSQAR